MPSKYAFIWRKLHEYNVYMGDFIEDRHQARNFKSTHHIILTISLPCLPEKCMLFMWSCAEPLYFDIKGMISVTTNIVAIFVYVSSACCKSIIHKSRILLGWTLNWIQSWVQCFFSKLHVKLLKVTLYTWKVAFIHVKYQIISTPSYVDDISISMLLILNAWYF